MIEFWKRNKEISIVLLMALIYSIFYMLHHNDETILSMLYAVALSYIAAFVFYILQVYYPARKRLRTVNQVIKTRVNNIIKKIDELYNQLFKLYIPNYNEGVEKDANMQHLLKFNFDDRTTIVNVKRIRNLATIEKNAYKTLRELVQELIYIYKDNSDFLYKTFPEYLSENLINVIEKINSSFFMHTMSFSVQSPIRCDFNDCKPNLFEDFWKLRNELKKCSDNY